MLRYLKLTTFLLVLTSFTFTLTAQSSLYMPRNIQSSYENGIRSMDGKPGPNYWQNYADYKIKAELLTEESKIKGVEKITYYNQSPDSLSRVVIRLYPDIFKKGSARDWYGGTVDMTDGVEIEILINGDTVKVDGRRAFRGSTNIIAMLNEKLAPGNSMKLDIKWTANIPDTAHLRMGNYRNDNFYVAYWYPQISVYDDIDGWDMLDYTGMAEFYNDHNNFEYEITVPDNFVVWGAGELTNIKEVLKPEFVERFNKAKESDDQISILTAEDYLAGEVTINNGKNVWKYSAKKVNDVSFAACKDYNWDASSVEVEDGRRVLCMAIYPDSSIHWEKAATYARATIEYMSLEAPGIPYPYPHTTSFCNGARGGGMETPMMANNGMPSSLSGHIGLLFHEIAHTYLPFYMGTNERKYAWMDEGWASFYPGDVVNRFVPDADYLRGRARDFSYGAGMELEMPLMTPTFALPNSTARYASYTRPANAYMELERLLGKDLFRKSMKEYMLRWAEKHPLPYDYFFTINDVVGEDLAWFWKPWFFERNYPDLNLRSVNETEDGYEIKVTMDGGLPTALRMTFTFDDGSEEVVEETARIFKDGNEYTKLITTDKKLKSAEIGHPHIPDTNKENNTIEL